MKKTQVLIADKDNLYVNALVEYLISHNSLRGMSICGVSNSQDIKALNGEFKYGIVSEDADELIDKECPSIKIDKKILLSENKNEDKESFFFKYQSMEVLENLILGDIRFKSESDFNVNQSTRSILGIYSPSKHELSLPFSLSVCKMLSEHGSVLFVDLSEISILSKLLPEIIFEDLIDAIYLLENQGEYLDLSSYIVEFQGFSIFSPIKTPSQSAYICVEQWKSFLERLMSFGFKYVVVFYGNLIQGFSEFATDFSKLILLRRPGDFYSLADEVFMEFMESIMLKDVCKEISLPMSGANLTKGGYRLDSLIEGKLLSFVKRELDEEFRD